MGRRADRLNAVGDRVHPSSGRDQRRANRDYGYQWWVTTANGFDAFAAAGFGGQLIEVVPALDLVVVVSNTVPDVPRLISTSFMALVDQLIAPAVTP
jgi:CubicO group peptidase (beta-lactamase class C family)